MSRSTSRKAIRSRTWSCAVSEDRIADRNPQRQLHAPALGLERGTAGRLAGRRILVVGAGQRRTVDDSPPVGNGRAMAMLFAREGAAVACADLDEASARETADLAARSGGAAIALAVDVAQPEQIARMTAQAHAGLGGLDGLVVNVGI